MRHLLVREVQRCSRYQDFLSVCLIRAMYPGAPQAEMESTLTRRIADMLRSTDIVGVIGQDIAVLLVHTPDSDAAMIADRMRDRVQHDHPSGVPLPERRVALTIGLASFPVDATSAVDLLARAQAQLEAAQRASG